MSENQSLKRSLSSSALMLYGIGTMLGAGIYVLIAKIAGTAGLYAPISFLASAIIVAFSAYSYGQMAKRYPQSAGEAVYIEQGLSSKWLARIVGYGIIITGFVSAAAIANGFTGYLAEFVDLPKWLSLSLAIAGLGIIAIVGVNLSVGVAVSITLLEIIGVCLVIGSSWESLLTIPARLPEMLPPFEWGVWSDIMMAAFLAFYAYVGFEDMVNMAEEVKEPEKVMPRAIIGALIVTTILYILAAVTAVVALPMDLLVESTAPFADIVAQNDYISPDLISIVSMIAIINGALVNMIMASRVLYGMARQGHTLSFLGHVNTKTKTPINATILVTLIVLGLAIALPLAKLAEITSFVILVIFALVNLAFARTIIVADESYLKLLAPIIGFLLILFFLIIKVLG